MINPHQFTHHHHHQQHQQYSQMVLNNSMRKDGAAANANQFAFLFNGFTFGKKNERINWRKIGILI